MKFISLFAGIGGFDLGLERAGMTCVGQVEYNPFCQKVLKKHWPHVKLMGDIHDVTGTEFGDIDLICGGFPCQPFSTAGKRKGTDDNRYLWPEMLRIIEVAKPAWVIGENVAGIVNMVLDTVCAELESKGFEVWPIIIPAAAVNAPHRRDRVWILAYSASNRRERDWQASEAEKGLQSEPGYAGELSGGPEGLCENVANSNNTGLQEAWSELEATGPEQYRGQDNWAIEPELGRVAHGIPNRVDRLKSIGNAVVPQVVEVIGRAILRAHILCAERLPDIKEARLTAYNS